ncbi:MAG: cold shock domain-containing protein [Bacteroidales bacterium]|nr:cold shock domain-containing protein [Bacteroidales bacterium]
MNKGKVKWYDETKGFGFIESEDGNDVFIHRTGLLKPLEGLNNDQEVEYEVKQGEKGLVAFNVK